MGSTSAEVAVCMFICLKGFFAVGIVASGIDFGYSAQVECNDMHVFTMLSSLKTEFDEHLAK